MNEIISSAAKTIATDKELLKEVYSDSLKPTAKNVGQALETLSSTLNVLLAPIRWAVYGFDIIDKKVKSKLEAKLSSTPIENLKEPAPHIVIPAYEALRYSLDEEALCDMYTNLIAASMDSDMESHAHPSFVEIIKQLSPFDANLLKQLADTKTYQHPIMKTRIQKSETEVEGIDWLLHIINPLFGINLSNKLKYSVSLENLQRLQLLIIDYSYYLTNDTLYFPIENGDIVTYCKENKANYDTEYDFLLCAKGTISITEFGKQFISVCIR